MVAEPRSRCNLMDVTLTETGFDRVYNVTWKFNASAAQSIYNPAAALKAARNTNPHKVPAHLATLNIAGNTVDNSAYLRTVSVTRQDPNESRHQWTINGKFETIRAGETLGELKSISPLLRPAEFWLETDTVTETIEEGWIETALTSIDAKKGDKLPIVNAAGIAFDTPLMRDRERTILAIKKNVRALSSIVGIINEFDNTTNEEFYYGAPQDHAAYLHTETGEYTEEDGVRFYTMVVRVLMSGEPIYRHVVNEGYRHFSEAPAVPAGFDDQLVIATEGGEPTPDPVLLAMDGTRLEKGKIGFTIPYRTRRRVSYQGLVFS